MAPAELLTRYRSMLSQPSIKFVDADGCLVDYTRVIRRIRGELEGPDAARYAEGCHRELAQIAREVIEVRR